MKKGSGLILFLFVLYLQTFSQTEHTKPDRFILRKMRKAGLIGLQAAYLSNGTLKWSGAYGIRNSTSREPVDTGTLFMIASCSKPVTALGLLKLQKDGKVSLDDSVNRYLPFRVVHPQFPGQAITIRMLLTHTASLQDDGELLFSLYTMKEGGDSPLSLEFFVKEYFVPGGKYYHAKHFSKAMPGTARLYSNAGFALAGYLIEQISGNSFREFMSQEIFKPLGMQNTCWYLTDIPHKNLATPHRFRGKRKYPAYEELLQYGFPTVADGQIRTTVNDYAKFLGLILNDGFGGSQSLLPYELTAEFTRIQFPAADKWQALAWNYNEFDNPVYYLLMPRVPSHTGVDPGVGAVVSFDTTGRNGVIIFTNTEIKGLKATKIFYHDLVKRLLKAARRVK